MTKEKRLEAGLVITTGLLLLFVIKHYEYKWMLISALVTGLIFILIKPLAELIAKGWYKLADILGFVVPKILLGMVYYIFLVPLAFLYKFTKKDPLRLNNTSKSNWTDRDHEYEEKDFIHTW